MPPPLIGGALSDDAVWRLTSDVCLSVWHLSVVYIGPKLRTERVRKTKIGTEVAYVTCDSDIIFKVKRSKVQVTRPLWLVALAGQHGHTVMVTYPYLHDVYQVTTCRPERGHIVAAAFSITYCKLSKDFSKCLWSSDNSTKLYTGLICAQ